MTSLFIAKPVTFGVTEYVSRLTGKRYRIELGDLGYVVYRGFDRMLTDVAREAAIEAIEQDALDEAVSLTLH